MSSREEIYEGDWIYNEEDLLKHVTVLKPEGFILNKLHFEKNETGKKLSLCFDIEADHPFSARISGMTLIVNFEQVEEIFQEVFKKIPNQNFAHTINHTTFYGNFRENIIGQEGYIFLVKNSVYNEMSFQRVKPYLDRLMKAALDFESKYKTLDDFYALAESMQQSDQANFYAKPFPPRKMIVKKILNAPDYEEYASRIVTHVNTAFAGTPLAAFVTALKAHLDKM